jgi:replicative DNA helicase
LKGKEAQAAKETDPDERTLLRREAKELSKELAKHVVPEPPQLLTDDVSPEKLSQLIVKQGGKMFLASAEGTAFEICKGRYSETANFDVYLKGHAGDPLRTDRMNREREATDHPALTCALAVQPDVIEGLAENTSMRGRGFLARWLYFIPQSKVGRRKTATDAVPERVKAEYQENILTLWGLPGAVEDGKAVANVLRFSAAADRELQEFERWLEPQLAEGEDLSYLAGWANKLAGAIARIAGVLHMAGAPDWWRPISRETVLDAIAIGRDYLLPHAQAAFAVMNADPKTAEARHVLRWLEQHPDPEIFSRHDLHRALRRNRRFIDPASLDAPLGLLQQHGYIRQLPHEPGRGRPPSPKFDRNPLWIHPRNPQKDKGEPLLGISGTVSSNPRMRNSPKQEGEPTSGNGAGAPQFCPKPSPKSPKVTTEIDTPATPFDDDKDSGKP